jgi:hypothetical protein
MEIDDKSIRQAIRDIMNYPNIHIQNEDRLVLSRFAFKLCSFPTWNTLSNTTSQMIQSR